MSLAYALLALALVVMALVGLAVGLLGVSAWVRWLLGRGAAVGLAAAAVTAAATLNTLLPRGCDAGGVPSVQRPVTAALTSVGSCHREGVAQLALVPITGVAGSVVVLFIGRSGPRSTLGEGGARRAGEPPTRPADAVEAASRP